MSLAPTQIDAVVLKGGVDNVTPTLTLGSGAARQALNFECGVTGGYTRIEGYERFDGRPSPTDTAAASVVVGATTTKSWAEGRAALADTARASIAAVPGSGPVRGVVALGDTVYAFRDNAGATALGVYKSSSGGWVAVSLYYTVSFTAGGAAAPAEGATLTKGGATATIKRVVRTSGAWAGNTAAGQLIITSPAGGNFSAGAATAPGTTLTLSGAQSQIALLPGGRCEFVVTNFAGQAATTRIYGCDGVNKAFEFDGDILVPISTGAATDKPAHVTAHRNYLFLALGSSGMFSAPGLPYDFTALSGAGEIAAGDTITGLKSMPGGEAGAALGFFTRNNTLVLYGSSSQDFNLVNFNLGTGALPYSLQNMSQTYAFDDRGAQAIQAALQYGNFNQTCVTAALQPFVNAKVNKFAASTLSRRKSQYRAFFTDGSGLYITIVNGKLLGSMPVHFPNVVSCVWEGKKTDGSDVIYFGSDNGMVYQMDKGTSFDGAAIDYRLVTNYSSAKSPRTLKRYRKASIELTSENDCHAVFDFTTSLGYDSPEYSQQTSEEYDRYTSGNRWDAFTWDSFFWDSHGIEPVECALEGTAENIALYFSGSSNCVAPFTLNSVILHYTPRRQMR